MSSINLLHISDLHIAEIPFVKEFIKAPTLSAVRDGIFAASHCPSKLLALTVLIRRLCSDLNGIVITGDIATTGYEADLEHALRFVDAVPVSPSVVLTNGVPTIGNLDIPIFLIPGNHDRYKPLGGLGYLPGNDSFGRMFAKYWKGDVESREFETKEFVVDVIGADFSLRSFKDCEPPWITKMYAQGRVYEDTLTRLIAESNKFRDQHLHYDHRKLFLIWAIHFPVAAPELAKEMKLLESEMLVQAANECGVSVLLSGHSHAPFELKKPEYGFRIFNAGSATQYHTSTGNHCQLLSIRRNGNGFSVDLTHFVLDEKNRFVNVKRRAATN